MDTCNLLFNYSLLRAMQIKICNRSASQHAFKGGSAARVFGLGAHSDSHELGKTVAAHGTNDHPLFLHFGEHSLAVTYLHENEVAGRRNELQAHLPKLRFQVLETLRVVRSCPR